MAKAFEKPPPPADHTCRWRREPLERAV
jgi:hypothetical protein